MRLAVAAAVSLAFVGWTAGALDTSVPQFGGVVAAASVTGTSAGTANTLITLTGRRRIVVCTSNLNADMVLTYNAANWLYLPSSSSVTVDLSASGLTFADGKVIGIYRNSGAATIGSIACSAH